jgi:hypothetical protein
MKKILPLVIIIFITTACNNKKSVKIERVAKETDTLHIYYPAWAKSQRANPDEENDTLYTSIGKIKFEVYSNGTINEIKGSKIATYHLKTDDIVTDAYLCFYKKNLIIYYTITDGENGASYVESFNAETQHRLWQANAFAFNLTQPVNKDNASYISTFSFVGKLNLDNGHYYWKHENLYDRETAAFNNFKPVSFVGNEVLFISKNDKDKSIDSAIVNDATGKLTVRK